MTRIAQPIAGNGKVSSLVASLAVAVIALLALAQTASADVLFGTPGSGAGQHSKPRAVAVDRSDETVYVADSGNNRVDVFDADGDFLRAFGWGVADGTTEASQTCTVSCFQGLPGSGGGQFGANLGGSDTRGLTEIAVDNDPASPSFHDVYVFDSTNRRVQRFTPGGAFVLALGDGVNQTTGGDVCTAASGNVCRAGTNGSGPGQFPADAKIGLGPGGIVHVLGPVSRVQKFDSTGALVAQLDLLPTGLFGGNANGLAVDSTGDFYTGSAGETGAIRKYDASGNLLNTFNSSFNIGAMAIDGGDNLFLRDSGPGLTRVIVQYDSAGNLLRIFYSEISRTMMSLAPYSNANGDVFGVAQDVGGNPGEVVHIPFPPPGPIVLPNDVDGAGLTKATSVGNQKATLNTAVNPQGKATTYHFEYVDQAEFEAEGFASPTITAETAVGSGFAEHRLSEVISGLAPQTTYRFRAVATNPDGSHTGPEATFTTLAPFEIKATWSTAVDTSSATLHAEVNPLAIAATGYFEYVDDATYQASGFAEAIEVPNVSGGESPLSFGSGEDPKALSAALHSLQPDTTYHYRIVAENSFIAESGPETTFTTYQPPDGPNTSCPNQAFRLGIAARLPDCRAYEMVSPVDKNNGDVSAGVASFDQASLDGQRITFSSWTAFADPQTAPLSSQFLAERGNEGWATQSISPPRDTVHLYPIGGTIDSIQFKAFTDDLCSGWLVQDTDVALAAGAPPGQPNLYRRDNCSEEESYELLTTTSPPGFGFEPNASNYFPLPQGFSADASRTVFLADAALTPNANPQKEIFQLYVAYDGGKLRLVSVLPNGAAATTHTTAGTTQTNAGFREDNVYHAVSADGSRVFWTASENTAAASTGANARGPGELYLRLNATEPQSQISGGECAQPTRACTIPVSESDALFWTADPAGTVAIYTVGEDLFEFDVASETPQLIAGGVKGVMGASEDASRIYFASSEALAPGAAVGKPNLYLYEKGAGFDFIATLSEQDASNAAISSAPLSPIAKLPDHRSSRVTPDGRHAAFLSTAPLTGYDNADASSGEPNLEVFRYDAEANGGAGELHCVSCNPSGARPVGREYKGGVNGGVGDWAAALLPGWETQLHPSRLLAGDGDRLFFDSYDALVLGDTNGRKDVYQWEAPGKGDCTTQSSSYFESNGGCLSLISSGQSPRDSEFFDATPSGSDVFFATNSSLLPQDPGLVDVYVAKVNGGFPPPPPPPPPCVGDACQSVPAPPTDPTPASAGFRGAGNLKSGPSCGAAAKRARKMSRKAKRARRAAKRLSPDGGKQMRRRSARLARNAKRLGKRAERCRARNRANANRGGSR